MHLQSVLTTTYLSDGKCQMAYDHLREYAIYDIRIH